MYIIQRVIPHYRVPLFRELYARTGAKVICSERPPDGTYLNYADPREHEWAEVAPFLFPDAKNAFRAEVPLEHILATYRPRSLLAEFGMRLSSTRSLVRARAQGRIESFGFWTQGWQMERGFSSPADLVVQSLRLAAMGRADALGAYSEEGADWLRRRLNVPVLALGNALDTADIRAAAAAATPSRHGSPQLLAVGRLTLDKRFADLLDVVRLMRRTYPHVALTVIGDGPERRDLEANAARDLGGAVRFVGAVHAEADLAQHFTGADFVVIPGAAGLAVNHALAYGAPVVAFARVPGGPRHHPEIEYVVEGCSGVLVRSRGAAAMAARLRQAIESGEAIRLREALKAGSPAPTIPDVVDRFERLFALLGERRLSEGARGVVMHVSPRDGGAESHDEPVSRGAPVAFLWDNFGPMHNDRCQAVAARLGAPESVLGVEIFGKSDTYAWRNDPADGFGKVTLFGSDTARPPSWKMTRAIVLACRQAGVRHAFFCHYERPEVFAAAVMLKALGVRLYTMMDSKFDDYPRHIWRELVKRVGHLPYHGGLAAGSRTRDYMRFLGHEDHHLREGYDAVSVQRLRSLVAGVRRPAFVRRDFLIVARLIPKKNIAIAIEAFRLFARDDPYGRRLRICGAGPLEGELRAQAAESGVAARIVFHGFEQTEMVAARMKRALALLLPSTEEQFGLVAGEAQALGLPVIVSTNVGARDRLVRSGVNGFIVEPDNAEGLAYFMSLLSRDEALWARLAAAAGDRFAPLADVDDFVTSVQQLISLSR